MRVIRTPVRHINELHFSDDGKRLIVVEGHWQLGQRTHWHDEPLHGMFHFDLSTGAEQFRAYFPDSTFAVCPRTFRIAFFSNNGPRDAADIVLFDPLSGRVDGCYTMARPEPVGGLQFTPDGKQLIHTGDGVPGLYDLERRQRQEVDVPADWACPSPCGRYVAFGHVVTTVSIWAGAKRVKDIGLSGANGMAWSSKGWLAFLHDGLHFGHIDRRQVGPPVQLYETREQPIIAFHPNGNVLGAGEANGRFLMWDAETQRPVREYRWEIGEITAIAFSPDGLTCAAGGEKGQVVVWDVDS